jgi:hypothetical protein
MNAHVIEVQRVRLAVPAGLSADEKHAYEQLAAFYTDVYYALFMGTRPQTPTALADSPVGLATFLIDQRGP